jgi:hypothetical protein
MTPRQKVDRGQARVGGQIGLQFKGYRGSRPSPAELAQRGYPLDSETASPRKPDGRRSGTCIDPKVQVVEAKSVCVVTCQRSPEPVFLKWKGIEATPEGDFFVRSGPGTVRSPERKIRAFRIRTCLRSSPRVAPNPPPPSGQQAQNAYRSPASRHRYRFLPRRRKRRLPLASGCRALQ